MIGTQDARGECFTLPLKWTGHLWQGRFFSCALDETYLWAAMRYVERNPVRARIVHRAENYRWSTVAAHCGRREDLVLTTARGWLKQREQVSDWPKWLAQEDLLEQLDVVRAIATDPGCGEPLLRELGRLWKYRVRRFRIVYAIDRKTRVIRLMAVGHRQHVYEELSARLRRSPFAR